jgi:hypothetical protein
MISRRPPESCPSFRVPAPRKCRRYWFGDPALPLAVSSAVRFFLRGARRKRSNSRSRPLIEFSNSSAYCPAETSRPAAASQRLLWALVPFSTCSTRGSTLRGPAMPASFRPRGLATLSAVYSPHARVGLVSSRRRSWDSPFGALLLADGIRRVSAGMNPRTVCPAVLTGRDACRSSRRGDPGRPGGPRFLGFDPLASPVPQTGD